MFKLFKLMFKNYYTRVLFNIILFYFEKNIKRGNNKKAHLNEC